MHTNSIVSQYNNIHDSIRPIAAELPSKRSFELFIHVEHMKVSLKKSDRLFVNFFNKIIQTEPVCGNMIVIVVISNVCNIATLKSEQTNDAYYKG
jgi:hypothetical protein